ncbi:MAG: MerR family transcriptional regulator [Candidatus Krumholzibacteriia bacterium]
MSTEPRQYTLADLVDATGFSRRQIRFYITRDLVPGAGDRGPNATYGEETLRRLQMIARLKQMKVEPAGRTLSLAEIRQVLDTLGERGAENLLSGGAQLTIVDTDDGRSLPLDAAADYLRSIGQLRSGGQGSRPGEHRLATEDRRPTAGRPAGEDALVRDAVAPYRRDDREATVSPLRQEGPNPLLLEEPGSRDAISLGASMQLRRAEPPSHLGPLSSLLRDLRRVLVDLLSDEQIRKGERGESWQRIRTPDIEIQVRMPDDERRRARLDEVARALTRLLAEEERP